MKSLERLGSLLKNCDNLFYTTPLVDVTDFIFPLLQRKFSYKTHENIWILKKNLFYCYHKVNFKKVFEPIPVLSVKDLSNMGGLFRPGSRIAGNSSRRGFWRGIRGLILCVGYC